MSSPASFTQHVARLVWLLVYRPRSTAEQKEALRGIVLAAQAGGHVITKADLNLVIADAVGLQDRPPVMPWLHELAARMAAHSVAALNFAKGARAADVLGVARTLASAPMVGDDGANFDALTVALQLTTISARLGRTGFVRHPTPIATTRVRLGTPVPTPAVPAAEREDDSAAAVSGTDANDAPAESVQAVAVEASGLLPELDRGSDQRQIAAAAFAPRSVGGALSRSIEELKGALTPASAPRLLDAILRACDDQASAGDWEAVARNLEQVIAREVTVRDADVKRAFVIYLGRAFRPGTLRGLAGMLAKHRELRPALEAIFVRAGVEGAEMLIGQMVASSVASERRAFRTALTRCPAAVTPLMHLLADSRWFVVRNAAELLGELGAYEAEGRLIATLRHSDARVRRSAAASLARLGSSRGVGALVPLLGDANAAVRLQAVHALSGVRQACSVPALLQALERERAPEVQQALVVALGAHPTDEAVERLVGLAQPGSLLSRRATSLRVAAVHALGEAGTHAALAALRQLQRDRERAVREAAERALADRAQGALAGR